MRVAVVHEWLVTLGGSESVLKQILECFPNADVFAVIDFLPAEDREFLGGRSVKTTFLQRWPGAASRHRSLLPIMPFAIEQLDMSGYDLVISSSHAVAKGILIGPDQLHICYCHSPIRYAWDLQHQYLNDSGLTGGIKGLIARWVLHKIRLWDVRTSNGVDHFIANSHFISRRIKKAYRRNSHVIYPPVDLDGFSILREREDFYFTASRMVPYKKIPLIVQAFSRMPDKRLVVIGDGPDCKIAKELAGKNVQILGYQPTAVLRDYLSRAKAFIFAAEEDFGIVPVEAQASGIPVIAFGRGGALETIRGLHHTQPTGIFFEEQSTAALVAAIEQFEQHSLLITPEACRDNALRFSQQRFRHEFSQFVKIRFQAFQEIRNAGTV